MDEYQHCDSQPWINGKLFVWLKVTPLTLLIQIWIHVALGHEDKGLGRKQSDLEGVIEKKSIINLVSSKLMFMLYST